MSALNVEEKENDEVMNSEATPEPEEATPEGVKPVEPEDRPEQE
jgi:hypothetical protein